MNKQSYVKSDFHFELPEVQIAKHPLKNRTDSRLLVLDGQTGTLKDSQFVDIIDELRAGDLLILNNTRVIPARIFAQKPTGGKVEVLIERVQKNNQETNVLAHVRSNKPLKAGAFLDVGDKSMFEVMGKKGALFTLKFLGQDVFTFLETCGHMPLPPYIDRADNEEDKARYQTVFNKHAGAVAAPTAGLHFDQALIDKIAAKGIDFAEVTLHVGAGTFQPVREESLESHIMHSEWINVPVETVEAVKKTKASGGRVVAIGTTAVRALESAAQNNNTITPYQGETDIFIHPPHYRFKVVDALVTNFHLPESTLIMLVSSFAGFSHTMAAYHHAVAENYRFFSYGDAMFITPQGEANEV